MLADSLSWLGLGVEQMLQSRDPILFYDDVTLFEDELHDHGAVQLNVKVRVMPR